MDLYQGRSPRNATTKADIEARQILRDVAQTAARIEDGPASIAPEFASNGRNVLDAPSFTAELAEAISALDAILSLACNDVELLRERLFGGWPQADETSEWKTVAAAGTAADLMDRVQAATARAMRMNETVQVLSARV